MPPPPPIYPTVNHHQVEQQRQFLVPRQVSLQTIADRMSPLQTQFPTTLRTGTVRAMREDLAAMEAVVNDFIRVRNEMAANGASNFRSVGGAGTLLDELDYNVNYIRNEYNQQVTRFNERIAELDRGPRPTYQGNGVALREYIAHVPINPCQGCDNLSCHETFAKAQAMRDAQRLNQCNCGDDVCWRNYADKVLWKHIKAAQPANHVPRATTITPPEPTPIQAVTTPIDPSTIPDPETIPYQFTSEQGDFRASLERQYKDLYKISPQGEVRQSARQFGLLATQESDNAFHLGHEEDASFYKELGKGFLDIAVGLDPVTGFARSTYELFTGKNMITGVDLSTLDRSLAFLGVMTAGTGRSLAQASRTMGRIYEGAAHLIRNRDALRTAIREGEVLAGRVEPIISHFPRSFDIKNVASADVINARILEQYPTYLAPFQHGSHVIEFTTTRETRFVRVHNDTNQPGSWLMKSSALRGLTPEQIRVKYALPATPTHVSDVIVPAQTTMYRGAIQYHQFVESMPVEAASGAVQYSLTTLIPRENFRNARAIGEVFQ